MSRKVRLWPALALLALVCPSPAFLQAAEEPPARPGKTYVVLIGVSEYGDKQILPRPKAEDDAKALHDVLTGKDHLGVPASQVRLLLGKPDEKRKSLPATRANILEAVKWAASEAKRDDLVVFGFFGQGGSLGERGDRACYFASDSTLKDRAKNAVAAADLSQELDKLKGRFCSFVDVNFKGFDPGKESVPELSLSGESAYKEFIGDEGDEHNPLPGRVLFLATSGLAASPDLKDHGLFASALITGLKGSADTEGGPDGLVTVDELAKYVGKEILELARKNDKVSTEPRRTPAVIGGQNSHFDLTYNPEVHALAVERFAKFQKLAKDNSLNQELADEGRKLLERMPRLQAQRKLRDEYAKYAEGKAALAELKQNRLTILESTKLPNKDARDYATKVLEAVDLMENGKPPNRPGYVKEINKGELVANAVRGLYRRADEKIPDELNDKLDKAKDVKRLGDLGLMLQDARMKLGKREDLDNGKDLHVSLQRMLRKLDAYTDFIDPETVSRFDTEVRGNFSGVGIQIRKDAATDMLQVVTPIKNSPSYKQGILAGDLVTTIKRSVDSKGTPLDKPEIIPTKGLPLTDAVKKILGERGTKVTLTIQRDGVNDPFDVELTRSRIELESVFGVKRGEGDEWDFWLDKDNKIGYVRLSGFADNTDRDLAAVVQKLLGQGMKGFVLDLRFNPGGLLDASERISDLFIEDGPIVSIRRPRDNVDDPRKGKKAGTLPSFPMVCLINGESASASEIVSACLQDHKRATIVGERSFGKGSVQYIESFEGGKIKYTVATFWRPSGKNLNKSSTTGKEDEEWGVMPNDGYVLTLPRKEREDLFEHQRNSEIIPRKDKPAPEPKTEFKDRQLELGVKYLRDTITAKK